MSTVQSTLILGHYTWITLLSFGTDLLVTSDVHVRCHHLHQLPFPDTLPACTCSVHSHITANFQASRKTQVQHTVLHLCQHLVVHFYTFSLIFFYGYVWLGLDFNF